MFSSVIPLRRFSVISSRPFDDVVQSLEAAIGRTDSAKFGSALRAASNTVELSILVEATIGPSGLMEFCRFDQGEVLRKDATQAHRRILRLIVGNPLIMKDLVTTVPDAASYAPITILVDQRDDGVHLSYDSMASLIAASKDQAALATARDLDDKVESLLSTAAI